MAIVGSIPEGLPSFAIPSFTFAIWRELLPAAILISLVGYVETVSVVPDILKRGSAWFSSLGKPNNPESIFAYTGQTIYGGFGPTAQHSYFQLLHQGPSETSADFIASRSSHSALLNSQADGQFRLLSGKIKQVL